MVGDWQALGVDIVRTLGIVSFPHTPSPSPAHQIAHLEVLKVTNSQGQTALPAHRHQVGTCQALNLRTKPWAMHLDVHLGKEDLLALQARHRVGRICSGHEGWLLSEQRPQMQPCSHRKPCRPQG